MNRVNVYLSALAALGLAASAASAQAPAGAPAAAPTRGTAVFNVVKVQKDYQKWQYFAEMMNKERTAKGAELAQIRNAVVDIEGKLRIETVEAKKKELEQQLVGLQRQFEDKERMIRKEIEDKSATHLRQLFAEIRTVVDKVAEVNGFTLVLAFPDALTAEEMSNPLYIEMKMRPPAGAGRGGAGGRVPRRGDDRPSPGDGPRAAGQLRP